MPGFIAKKLCPQLVIVPLNFEKYSAASKEVEQVLSQYDKESLSVSMDEAVLDITNYLTVINSSDPSQQQQITTPTQLVEEIRAKIYQVTNLTASGGMYK
jgi:DNA polymerase kappa